MSEKKVLEKNCPIKIQALKDELNCLTIRNYADTGDWNGTLGFDIISLDGEITVCIGTGAPDALDDALYAAMERLGFEFDICGDMGFNEIHYTDIYRDDINGGPNEWDWAF